MNEFIVFILIISFSCIILYYAINALYEHFQTDTNKIIAQNEHQQNKIKKFINTKKNEETKENKFKINHRALYEMYYNGVPDTFDINGNRIPGVEPDAQKAIKYLNLLINSPEGNEEDVVNLAKIYHQGMHKFERNLDEAENIYLRLSNKNIKQKTFVEVLEGIKNIQKTRVYSWLNLPIDHDPTKLPTDEPEPIPVIQLEDTGDALIDNDDFNFNQIIQQFQFEDQEGIIVFDDFFEDNGPVKRDAKEYNDLQNTHDNQVLNTIKISLDKLSDTIIQKNVNTSLQELKNYLNTLPENDKTIAAFDSLEAIENEREVLANVKLTVPQTFNLVWNRIHEPGRFDEEIQKNLRNTMYEELVSMQEHGMTVCNTGMMTRLVDTLNGVDEDVSIKPAHAINEEMMIKSAKIRKDLMDEESDEEKELLDRGTSVNQEKFEKKLKDTIIVNLKKDYVDSGIVPQVKFNAMIKEWIDFI